MKQGVEEEWWAAILEKQLLELPILDTFEVKEDTHEYNGHTCRNKHKVCSYEDPCFAWVDHPISGLQDYMEDSERHWVKDPSCLDYLETIGSNYPSPYSFSWG